MSRINPVVMFLLLIILFVVGYLGFWFITSQSAQANLERWIGERQAEGYTVSHGTITASGFPLEVVIDVTNPMIIAPDEKGAWRWRGSKITGSVKPWAFGEVSVSTSGTHSFSPPLDWQMDLITLTEGTISVNIGLAEVHDTELVFDKARIMGLSPVGGLGLEALSIRHQDLGVEGATHTTPTRNIIVTGTQLEMPPGLMPSLGRWINDLTLTAQVLGTIDNGPLNTSLYKWQDDGGVLNVNRLDVNWRPLRVQGQGALALTRNLQPAGSLSTSIQGFFEMVDSLTQNGVIQRRDASMAKVILGAMARRPEDGSPPTINMSVSISRGKIYVGPVPLIALPTLSWGFSAKGKSGAEPFIPITPGFELNSDGSITDTDKEAGPEIQLAPLPNQ